MLPLSLYIHIPWCIRKCPYCDFNSHEKPKELPEIQYIHALLEDLDQDISLTLERPITSIFIGGGTPSLLSERAYALLFEGLQQRLTLAPDIEITLEANPSHVEQARFKAYRMLGINRLSLGIQSFNPSHLKALGRIHDDKAAHQAILAAREAGFENLNLDLMHGLPQQSVQEGLQDLKTALSHKPEHLSWYQLTLEPNTLFYKKQPELPHENILEELEQTGISYLAANHYQQYEISAFSKLNRQSKHNLNYWQFGDYYGIGAGAHGKLTTPDSKSVCRTRKQRQPKDYLNPQKPYLIEKKTLQADDLLFEFMLNVTRLDAPIPYLLFTAHTGLSIHTLMPKLLDASRRGFLECRSTDFQVTAFGRRFTNDLQRLFLPEI